MPANPFNQHLDRNPANYQPLTPLSLLARAAAIWPDHTAIIHGRQRIDLGRILCALPAACLGAGRSAASASATRSR